MKSKQEIEEKIELIKAESHRIASEINACAEKLKKIPEGVSYEHLRRPIFNEKTGLHLSLGLTNNRWAELAWVVGRPY